MEKYKLALSKLRNMLPQLRIYSTNKKKKRPKRMEIFLGIGFEDAKTDGLILNHKCTGHVSLSERILYLD